ncbi:MAG: choice-of-anchor D domain-containing protein, partial [Thermoanaerobaculia bacterium]
MVRSGTDRPTDGSVDPEFSSGDEMLDLPLELPLAPGQAVGEPEPPPEDSPEEPHPPAPPPRRRRGLLIALALLPAVALGLYFLMRPAPPRAAAIPESLDLGQVRLDSPGVEEELVIVNQGEKPMTVAQIEVTGDAAGEFQLLSEDCSGRPLAGQERCTVALRFLPEEMGPRQAGLEVQGELANSPAVFPLAGVGVAPLVELDRTEIDFGGQGVAFAGRAVTLAVTNAGTAELELAGFRFEGPSAADFARQADRCSGESLPPGESCTLGVLFRPRAAGARRATLVIRSDAAQEPPIVRLTGIGEWSGPALELDVQSVDFGDTRLGGPPPRRTIRLTNRHEAAVSSVRVSLAAEGRGFALAEEDCGRSIEPGGSCRVLVVFEPRAEGAATTSVQFRHASMQERLEVPISGRGVAVRLAFRESAVEFDPIRVETVSGGRSITLENSGTASAEISGVEISGPEGSAFVKRGDRCSGATLEPGSGCSVELAFRPRREGFHRAELAVRPAPDRGPSTVVLTGSGVAPRLQVDRELLEFGDVPRTAHRDLELVLANRGTAGLKLERLGLAGDGAEDFRLITGTCPSGGGLAPGASCRLRVRFAPKVEGRRSAKLLLLHDGVSGPREVLLGGTALPPPIPRLTSSPGRLDFGPQPVGERSAILTLMVRNTGSGR